MTDTTTAAHARPNWQAVRTYEDIRFEREGGLAKITICRPEVRNAFRPKTLFELIDAFSRAREDGTIGVIIFTGEGDLAFCSGGDQRIRGNEGYVGDDGVPRLNVLDLQRLIRSLPKVVIAAVAGYAIGGGHVLVNKVVPLAELEATAVAWGRRILEHSPLAIRCLKAAFNAELDGQAGIQELAGHATQLFYMTEEAQEGRDAYNEKRPPDFGRLGS